jgi:hypothetical protein
MTGRQWRPAQLTARAVKRRTGSREASKIAVGVVDLSGVQPSCTIVPDTTPDRVNPSCAAEMVQVIALCADPFVARW